MSDTQETLGSVEVLKHSYSGVGSKYNHTCEVVELDEVPQLIVNYMYIALDPSGLIYHLVEIGFDVPSPPIKDLER